MCRRGQANIRNKSIDQPLDHPKYRRLPVQVCTPSNVTTTLGRKHCYLVNSFQSKKTPSKKQKSKTSIQSPQQQYNTTASIDANDQQSQQSSLHLVHPDMEPSSVNHTNASTSSEFVHMESSEERMTDESWGIVARARNRNESEQPIDSLVEQPTPYQLLLPSMQRDITRPESEQSLMVSESSRTDDVQMNIERSMWSRANGSQMSRLCLSVEEELRQPQINSDPQTVELMSDGEQLIESRKKKTIDSFIRLLQSPGKVVIRKRQASFEERERIKSQANCLIIQS